jgi:hypothetical protein
MKKLPFFMFGLAVLVCARLTSADSLLVPAKLQILVRVKQGTEYTIVPVSPGLDRSSVETALYYVLALPRDVNGNTILGMVPLIAPARSGPLTAVPSNLGFVWPAADAGDGRASIVRVRRQILGVETGAATTFVAAGDALHRQEALKGYTVDGILGSAFPRFSASELLVPISYGGITVKSNANAGGAVWEWWAMGKQFIDDYDYGRQLSMAIYTPDGRALQETGDNYGSAGIPLYERHPSPTEYVRNSVNHQSSRAIPLDWTPDTWSGSKDNPVAYLNARLGKELTIDWLGPDKVDRHWPVAVYESIYEGPPFAVAVVEAPTAYLTAEFNTYYQYDPKSDTLSPVTAYHTKVNLSGGEASGLIIATGSGPNATAMGVYISDPNAGLVLYDNSGPDGGHYGSSFSKWSVIYRSQVSTVWKFRTWIATDSVQNVQKQFHQLYVWGVTSRDPSRPSVSAVLAPVPSTGATGN